MIICSFVLNVEQSLRKYISNIIMRSLRWTHYYCGLTMIKNTITTQLKTLYSTCAQQEGGRQTWLDMAKGLAIILVVMGHRGFITDTTNAWLSTFHLPLFFMASGVLLLYKKEYDLNFSQFILKKLRSLMIPYLAFSALSIAMDLVMQPGEMSAMLANLLTHLIETLTLQGYSVMWFLPATFIAELILWGLHRLPAKNRLVAATFSLTALSIALYYLYLLEIMPGASGALAIAFRIIGRAVIAAAFMSYGMVFATVTSLTEKKENSAKNGRIRVIGLILGIILMLVNIIYANAVHSYIYDLNNLGLGMIVIYLILGVSGSCGVFLVCRNVPNIPLLTFYGRNSLIIFVTHLNCYVMYVGTIFYMHFYKSLHLPDIVNESVTANTYTMIFTFLLEIPVIILINSLFPFMLGRGYNRQRNA